MTHTGRVRSFAAALAAVVVVTGLALVPATAAGADPGGIVISELHYHAGSDLDTDDFVELANTAAGAIDVSGWSFSQGITAVLPAGTVIPAGGRIVLSPDAASFTALYGFGPDAIYTGKLSNSGETVQLVDAAANVVDTVSYLDASPWPGTPDGTGPSLELRDLMADNTLAESWAASTVNGGTPRARNSVEGVPAVTQVTATPQRPDPGQAVVVSARLPIGSAATLTYKVMFGADVTIPFVDDAGSPGGAGDGQFAASIPGQAAGQLVRYRVNGTSQGTAMASPDPADSIRYHGVVVKNPSVTSPLPVIEWFMPDAVYKDILANHRYDDYQGEAVIAYNGAVYDNARMSVRGNTSRSMTKVSWKVEMPVGHELDMGPKLPYTLDEFAIQRDPDAYADLSWATVAAAGARSLSIQAVRTQRNGQFWSLGRLMELEDGTWRKAQGVDNWAIYKGDGGSLAKTSSVATLVANEWLDKKSRKSEDYSDVWNLSQRIDASPSAAQKEWMYQNINIPEVINYMAINSVIRHTDSGWYNWFIARDTEGTGRWELWHWDLDYTFTTPARDGKGVFLTPDTSNRLTQAVLAYPDWKEMFMRRLRTLADQFLPAPRFENQWDAIAGPSTADWNLDVKAWGGLTPAEARGRLLDGLADRRNVIANNTGAGKPVPASQSAEPNVVINEIQYHPAGGDAAEFLELTNPSATESVDLSGWTIDGIGLTIQPGTVLLPKANVVFVSNDVAFRAAYAPANRFVGGTFRGHLDHAGQTLTLRQGTRVVDEVTYSPLAPWPAAAAGGGASLELVNPTADNSLPSNWSANPSSTGTPGLANSAPVIPDTANPTTAITAPAEGTAVYGPVTVTATASDDIGVVQVALRVDGSQVGIDTSAPYSFSWNANAVGPHTLQTVATDGAGKTGSSVLVHVSVPADTTPPGAPGTPVASNVGQQSLTLSWSAATDDRGVAGYRIVRNGSVLPGTVTGTTFTDTGLTPATTYRYTVRAVDTSGLVGPDSGSVDVTTLAATVNLFSDLWTAADGAAWQAAWIASTSAGTVDTLTNAGRLTITNTSGAFARAQLNGLAARTDTEALFSFRWTATGASAYFTLNLRGSGGWTNAYRPRNGYGVEFSSSSSTITVNKAVNGTTTDLKTVSGAQPLSTSKRWVRMRVSGSTIQVKTWLDGQAEPSAWTATVTDASVTAAGQLFFSLARGSSNTGTKSVLIDDLTVKDAS
jgi:chitodextrinase